MKKNSHSTLLMVILVPVVLYITIMLVFGHSATSWHVSEVSDTGSKTSYANHTLLPGISGYIDRTGMRGFQDTELQLETREFSTLGGLYGILPQSSKEDLKRVMASTPTETKDIKGTKVNEYKIDSYRPFDGKSPLLPLDLSYIQNDELKNYWTWEYSIFEYKDGTYRFVVRECPS